MKAYDFSGQDLSGRDFRQIDLTNANLAETNMTKANFAGTYLRRASLRKANLAGANLTRTDLRGVLFHYANLAGANLKKATLVEADLREATLTRANFAGTDLSGANLTGVVMSGVLGLSPWVKQCALLERIRSEVLANPDVFDMEDWHGSCGTAHCLAGWAQHLTGVKGVTSVVASGLIPVAAPLFFGDTASVLLWLENREWVAQAHLWVDQSAA